MMISDHFPVHEHLAFERDYLAGMFLVLRVPVTISSLARVPEGSDMVAVAIKHAKVTIS